MCVRPDPEGGRPPGRRGGPLLNCTRCLDILVTSLDASLWRVLEKLPRTLFLNSLFS